MEWINLIIDGGCLLVSIAMFIFLYSRPPFDFGWARRGEKGTLVSGLVCKHKPRWWRPDEVCAPLYEHWYPLLFVVGIVLQIVGLGIKYSYILIGLR